MGEPCLCISGLCCVSPPQLVDILKGYVDMGVMMQKPSAGGERELRRHYKVHALLALVVQYHVCYAVH